MLRGILVKLATRLLQKVFGVEPPVVPSSQTKYPMIGRLPGQLFRPSLKGKPYITEKSGKLTMSPGDHAHFKKFPGDAKEVAKGVYEKILPNGNKVTSRLALVALPLLKLSRLK